jgi:hypothetical protein
VWTTSGPSGQPKRRALEPALVVHATKKRRDRLPSAAPPSGATSTTGLGDWYATAIFWRAQVALFVNESTLLPLVLPLAPSAQFVERFRVELFTLLGAHGTGAGFIEAETKC